MEKIKYFTQKELKKLFRSIEQEKDCADFFWGAESLLYASMEVGIFAVHITFIR